VILGLKIAVGLVTVLLTVSLIALALGKKRLHGRINLVFFILTLTAVVGFEVIIRFINPELTAQFSPEQRQSLHTHLWFSIPSTILLPIMFWSGSTLKKFHPLLGLLFLGLWIGTFVTGIFFLPHQF
jgi:Ca2+/Na+ antiporter